MKWPSSAGWPAGTKLENRFLRFLVRRLRIVLGIVLRIFLGFALEDDFCLRAKALVIGQLDDFAHMDVSLPEMQRVIGANIGWEPILPVNLLAVSHKFGRKVLLNVLLLFCVGDCLGHGFATALHDLKI